MSVKEKKVKRNKYLMREFRVFMLFTVAMIAVGSIFTIWGCDCWQKKILPNKAELYIEATAVYADGRTETKLYTLDLNQANEQKTFSEENDIEPMSVKSPEEDTSVNIRSGDTYFTIESFLVAAEEETIEADMAEEQTIEADMTEEQDETEKRDKELTYLTLTDSQIQTGTKLAVSKIENSFSQLSPKKQQVYTVLSYAKIILPIFYSLIGVILCALLFYKSKIAKPVAILSKAAEEISAQNLDFTISCDSRDELGRLCDSFEIMRRALWENNERMITMFQEKRLLQSSVAHDLRNPITIIKGYAEYLLGNAKNGTLSEEQLEQQLSNLSVTANRMESYVESIHELNCLEDMELCRETVELSDFVQRMKEDFSVMTKESGKKLHIGDCVKPAQQIQLDTRITCRILENILSNALRYAKENIWIAVSLEEEGKEERFLRLVITDDGPGFPTKMLREQELYFFTTEKASGHMGMGTVISRILCKKHGGTMQLENRKHGGAKIIVKLFVS